MYKRQAEIAKLKRERDQFKAGHIRYRALYRAECDKFDVLIGKHDETGGEMEHKDIEAEIKKKCEKCGFSGFPHVVRHRPPDTTNCYGDDPVYVKEAMVFTCTRCGYEWEIEVT